MSKNIRLHPQYGLNPSISQCFYCGKDDKIILAGAVSKKEMPMKCGVIDMEPCNECKGWMEKGIIMISIRDEDLDSKNPYRTGGWCVVKDEAVERWFDGKEQDTLNKIKQARFCFIQDTMWDIIGLPREDVKDGRI